MTLYQRTVSPGGKVTYTPHSPGEGLQASEFDNGEIVTWAVSLGVVQMEILRKMLPEHARNARKIKALEDAIFDLAKGHGKPISGEMVDYVVGCWNRAMMTVQRGLEPREGRNASGETPAS